MKVNIFIKDKTYKIEVGPGTQTLKWLGDVAHFRYEEDIKKTAAIPIGIRREMGVYVRMEKIIREVIDDDENIWVILKDEFDPNNFIYEGEEEQEDSF